MRGFCSDRPVCHLFGLGLHASLHQLPRGHVQPQLPRDVHGSIHHHRLAEGGGDTWQEYWRATFPLQGTSLLDQEPFQELDALWTFLYQRHLTRTRCCPELHNKYLDDLDSSATPLYLHDDKTKSDCPVTQHEGHTRDSSSCHLCCPLWLTMRIIFLLCVITAQTTTKQVIDSYWWEVTPPTGSRLATAGMPPIAPQSYVKEQCALK